MHAAPTGSAMRKIVPDMTRRGRCGGGGFTLVEVITILIILGILAVVIAPKVLRPSMAGPRASEIAAQLRYLHLRAMKENLLSWGMKCDGTNYWAFNGTDPDAVAARNLLPGESGTSVALASKDMGMSSFTVIFDQNGIPYSPTTATKLANALTVTVTEGGGSATITITPETGFIP